MDALQQRVEKEWPFVCDVWRAMHAALVEVGLEGQLTAEPEAFSRVQVTKDPFDSSESLLGEWLVAGQPVGNIVVHANGQAFAEYDVVKPHPTKPKWFIEATTAWGAAGNLSSELRLLPAL